MAEMLREHAGNIVVFTGRNRGKIDRILAALKAGLNVLADKPWIITAADLPKLEEALALAQRKNLAAYDIMTERYEVTSELQRELVNDREVFGTLETGSAQEPAVRARSVHHVMKVVAGTPLRRPRVVLRYRRIRRRTGRRRHARGGPGAVDGVSRSGAGLPQGHRSARGDAAGR